MRQSPPQQVRSNHQEPPLTTKKATTNKERALSIKGAPVPARPDDVEAVTWADWVALRKAKAAPITETVLRDAKAEAGKADMTLETFLREWCSRGSQGLRADWIKPKGSATGPPKVSGKHGGFEKRDYGSGGAM